MSSPMSNDNGGPVLMTECVNAHDRCYEGGPCPYCEPVKPLRDTSGKFAAVVWNLSNGSKITFAGGDDIIKSMGENE